MDDASSDRAARTAGPGLDERATTGEPAVDAALRGLDRLDGQPVHEHPRLLEEVHRELEALLRVPSDAAPTPPAGP